MRSRGRRRWRMPVRTEEKKAYAKAWYQKNKKKIAAKKRKRTPAQIAKDKAKMKEYSRAAYERNKDEIKERSTTRRKTKAGKAYAAAYFQDNKEAIKAKQRERYPAQKAAEKERLAES